MLTAISLHQPAISFVICYAVRLGLPFGLLLSVMLFVRFDLKFSAAFKLFAPKPLHASTSSELLSALDNASTNLKDSSIMIESE